MGSWPPELLLCTLPAALLCCPAVSCGAAQLRPLILEPFPLVWGPFLTDVSVGFVVGPLGGPLLSPSSMLPCRPDSLGSAVLISISSRQAGGWLGRGNLEGAEEELGLLQEGERPQVELLSLLKWAWRGNTVCAQEG